MTYQEYRKESSAVHYNHRDYHHKLNMKYVKANASKKIGDVIYNGTYYILIEEISYTFSSQASETLQIIYLGPKVTKKGKTLRPKEEGQILQMNIQKPKKKKKK